MAFAVGLVEHGQFVVLETPQGFGAGAHGFDQGDPDAGGPEGLVGLGADAAGDDGFGAEPRDGFGGLDAGATPLGIIAAAASGFLFSLHSLIAKKFLTENVSAVSIYMYILPVGALTMLPFVDFMPNKSLVAWTSLIAMGFICNWVPYLCFCGALKRLPATRVSVLETSSEPFLAAMFAFLWWGESFTLMGWLGAFLVIGAVVLVILSKDKLRPPKEARAPSCQ